MQLRRLEVEGLESTALLRKSIVFLLDPALGFFQPPTPNEALLIWRYSGPIKTPMTANVDFNNPKLIEKVPLGGRPGQPQEVAKLISFLLSDESSYTSGSVYVIDGAWSA